MGNAVEDALTTCRICPKRPLAKNWMRLQSNGRLESMILSETELLMRLNLAAQAAVPPVPSVSIVQDQVRQSEPRIPTAPPVTKPWAVTSIDGVISDNNGSVCHYAWQVKIRNNTENDITVAGAIGFVDNGGSSVGSPQIVSLRLPAH